MSDKELQKKAIKIKGKDYIQVKDRLIFLSENIERYSIETEKEYITDLKMFIIKATLTIDDKGVFTGYSQAVIGQGNINTTSSLENAETSAVGRACAMAGIGIIDSVASVEEMNKAGVSAESNKPVGSNTVTCKDCGSHLIFKWDKTNAGKFYKGYFCPNSKTNDREHHKPFEFAWIDENEFNSLNASA